MKYRGIFEYEYPTEHKPPVSIDVHLHGDCVKGKIIEWEYRPLDQEPKTGHWIPTYGNVECSVCGSVKDSRDVGKATHYCDFCGAMMVEPQESEVDNGNDDN